jgi:hypothetical protein
MLGPPAGVFAWRGELFPQVSWWRRSCPRLVPLVMAHTPVGVKGELARGGDLCEAEICRARRRLVMQDGDLLEGVPLIGNSSEMLPASRENDILPARVLTEVLSLPRLESWP